MELDIFVYQELKKVREGHQEQYKQIQQHHVIAASDEALRELATSWGIFQIQGYKVVPYGIPLSKLRSQEELEYSVSWIAKSYGHHLKRQEYREVFFLHSPAAPVDQNEISKIQDSKYILNGLKHITWFKKKEHGRQINM